MRRLWVGALVAGLLSFAVVGWSAYSLGDDAPRLAMTLSPNDTGRELRTIGQGPLERVVELKTLGDGTVDMVEPFTRQEVGHLTTSQANATKGDKYVVQSYGYWTGAHKTISLTFDDGPNPEVTPKLLDLLGTEKVPATFFLVGRFAVQNEDLVRRMIKEGHAIGVHTMTHPEVNVEPDWREQLELAGTKRALRAITGREVVIWRMPHGTPTSRPGWVTVAGLLRGQQLGYLHVTWDFDSLDWEHDNDPAQTAADIPLPDLTGDKNLTILMHDGGGPNRDRTVAYVKRLITEARKHGYTFQTVPQVNPPATQANRVATQGTWKDSVALILAKASFQWPTTILASLFLVTLLGVAAVGIAQAVLASRRFRQRQRVMWPPPGNGSPTVAVILAAYNEEPVIERTLHSVLASDYPIREVIVVDDGSADGTAAAVQRVSAVDHRVRLISKANGGKAAALNDGVRIAQSEIVVTLDADTLITESTVTNLVRHFAVEGSQRLGAVAGVVKVANKGRNLLTRWQSLEYVTQIGIERAAQDALGAIMIIPGACAAWRVEAIKAAGGYSRDTLAEDCDLALTLHQLGWQITQDDEAAAFTEAPETVDDLLAQRTRWTFGTLQAIVKHRNMILRRRFGALGVFFLPNYVLTILIPLIFLPFLTVMTVVTLQQEGPALLLRFFLIFLTVQIAISAVGVAVMREDWRLLYIVPIYRIVFEPLRAYLIFTSVGAALKGVKMGWNKLTRTGSVDGHLSTSPPQTSTHAGPKQPIMTRPSSLGGTSC